MDPNFLDLYEEKAEDFIFPASFPYPPDNQNIFDPTGHQERVWHSLGDLIGTDLSRVQNSRWNNSSALGLSIAMQCADVITTALMTARMQLWRKPTRRESIEVGSDAHWLADMLSWSPNDSQTWSDFWTMIGLHMVFCEEAYIAKRMARNGEVLELLPVEPGRVTLRYGEDNQVFYEVRVSSEYNRSQLGLDADTRDDAVIFTKEQMIHIRGRSWSGERGFGNLTVGAPIFRLMEQVGAFQEHTFKQKGMIVPVFETENSLSGDMGGPAFQRLKDDLTHRWAKGLPIVLEYGIKLNKLTSNAREAQSGEALKNMITMICGLFRVPPHMIGAMETVKYDNQSAADNAFGKRVMEPLATRIEDAIKLSCLKRTERDLYPMFDRQSLMAGDMATLIKNLDIMMQRAVITRNEFRELSPLPLSRVKGGDVFLTPVNVARETLDGEILQIAADGQNPGAGQEPGKPNPAEQERSLRIVSSNTER